MSVNVTEIFGSNVFSTAVMRERLPKGVFREVMDVMKHGGNISMATADIVANAMKDWAVEKGATHYTHWFQPLTGITAEKHDAFITRPEDGKTILQLTGKQLIMGESDASSFPSGGLRSTHYARGYTAWDMTSPAFVKEMTAGTILCIPTIFVSYTGEALDKKTPLLRSMEAINTQGLRILRLFGNTEAQKVFPSVGPEQEYFLVDREKYLKRRDLIYTGRTLFGAPAPKGQELEDQYFGVIRDRVGSFMSDLNEELWKLGIPATTQHNEVAPAQHEMAPIYTMCNLAVDQNQLTMETMKRVATRHGLVQSASCVGNEHRLGGQEAPPAIISIFLGDQLESVVDQIISNAESVKLLASGKLDSGVSTVPVLNKDATDRNRTTPFAFTGNKFEFRMVGSSDSIADANTTLNAIVAEALCEAADQLEQAGDFNAACTKLIHDNMAQHQRIIFNGDGYSDEWVAEAARRGLPNLASLVDAVPALTTEKAVKLFTKFGIYTQSELEARADIMYETYVKTIKIEANTMIHMAAKHYIPTVIGYTTRLAQSITAVASACPEAELSVQRGLLKDVSARLAEASAALEQLKPLMDRVDAIQDVKEMAIAYRTAVVPAMDALRYPIDQLELMVDKSIWPVPTYGDLMFEV